MLDIEVYYEDEIYIVYKEAESGTEYCQHWLEAYTGNLERRNREV